MASLAPIGLARCGLAQPGAKALGLHLQPAQAGRHPADRGPSGHRKHAVRSGARCRLSSLSLACLVSIHLLPRDSSAAENSAAAEAPLQSVTITGRTSRLNVADVAGFAAVPLAQSPYSGSVINLRQLQEASIHSLGDVTRLDASTTDAYNAPGYWGQLAVRGYTLDPRFNFRRDGLPINAETVLATANKQALEVLKGVSGLQAGTSSPGGLVNLVVKRPQGDSSRAQISALDSGEATVALDVSRRLATGLAWRINAEAAHLDPALRNATGRRHLLALAGEAALGATGLLEAEWEQSHQRQPSMPGFSLLGRQLPPARGVNPRTNLNNQAWSLPVEFEGSTGSLRYTHALGAQWQGVAHLMQQRLTTQDRVAFPYGCSAEGNFDVYCSDGSFDLYDFRSEGERRYTTVLELSVQGQLQTGAIKHQLGMGVLASRYKAEFNRQAFNYVGTGSISGKVQLPSDPSLTDENTNRSERSTELRVQDRIELAPATHLWAGLRHTRLERDSARTDGSRATTYTQSVSTPWLGISHDLMPALMPGLMVYANTGQGVESEVAPNRSRYRNAGMALPALKSRQVEVGLKQRLGAVAWNLAAFNIDRPLWSDVGPCDVAGSCERRTNGRQRHRGLEADAEWTAGPVSLRGSALLLTARITNTLDPSQSGLQPTNVPARTLKMQGAYNVLALPGLTLVAFATREGARKVLPDNSVTTPGWTRLDLGARFTTSLAGHAITWRLGVDNVGNERAWKEAPYQFGHAYLYPLPARQWHLFMQTRL
jgi:iron complex outermembrane recepter protein